MRQKNSKPFTDFEKLISLQQANSIDMGRVLHSKTVAVDLIEHISSLTYEEETLNQNYKEQK